MSEETWTERSRYQMVREYTVVAPDRIEVICHDVLYCSFGGKPEAITSIDPDGGPFLSVGRMIRSYQIKRIVSYHQPWKGKKDMMRIVLEVEGGDASVPTPLSRGDTSVPTPLSRGDTSVPTPLSSGDASVPTPLSRGDTSVHAPQLQ